MKTVKKDRQIPFGDCKRHTPIVERESEERESEELKQRMGWQVKERDNLQQENNEDFFSSKKLNVVY